MENLKWSDFQFQTIIMFIGMLKFNPFTPKSAKFKIKKKLLNFILQDCQKQTASHESTAQ